MRTYKVDGKRKRKKANKRAATSAKILIASKENPAFVENDKKRQ
jgi:hypothetical protein